MAKLERAPTACPQCDAEREWRCLGEVSSSTVGKEVGKTVAQGMFGLVGRLLFGAVTKGTAKVKYQCSKCGYCGVFLED